MSASTMPLADAVLRDLGGHRFKDLAVPERLYQLRDRDFPRLKSLFQTNLPIPANPLVGRRKELADVLRALHGTERIVTVTGPGGIGKTRFALAAAAGHLTSFRTVSGSRSHPVRDPGVVLPTIARALSIDGDLAHRLRDKRCLLLIDNFEQVVAAARQVAELVGACPTVRVLATSREPLRVSAEREYRLRPLPSRSASGSTDCRLRSSSPPPGSGFSSRSCSSNGSTAASPCS